MKDSFEKKIPNPFINYFQNQGLNIPIERVPHLKTVLLYQKLTETFIEKNLSNINALMHGINIGTNSR